MLDEIAFVCGANAASGEAENFFPPTNIHSPASLSLSIMMKWGMFALQLGLACAHGDFIFIEFPAAFFLPLLNFNSCLRDSFFILRAFFAQVPAS